MNGWLWDLRFALRMVAKRPLASGIIVVTLALGIGINTTFFSGFYGMVLKPLPFAEPGRLVAIDQARPHLDQKHLGVSPGNYLDFRDDTAAGGIFVGLAAYQTAGFNLYAETAPERVEGARVSAELLTVLGIEPALGRAFTAEEQRGDAPVALVSDALWRRRLGGERSVLGSTLRIDGRVHEIVGVMPQGFAFPNWHEVWIPLSLERSTAPYEPPSLQVVGRLAADASLADAAATMQSLAARQAAEHPETGERWTVMVRGLHAAWMPPVTQVAAFVMQGMVMLVLLVVCANVANIIVAQASARHQEMAVRTVMGASRWRLIRQSLIESGVLAILGAVLGLIPASFYDEWVRSLLAIPIPYWLSFEFAAPVFAFTAVLTLVTAVALGLLPVLRRREGRLAAALRAGGRTDTGASGRLRSGLVVFEYAMAVLILVAALLMVSSYTYLERTDQGFAVEGVASLHVAFAGQTYDEPARGLDFLDRAQHQLEALSEVQVAAAVDRLPISRRGFRAVELELDDRAVEAGEGRRVTLQAVSTGYFATLGIPLRQGRTFTPVEIDENRPVVLISAALADHLWPGQDPLRRRLRVLGSTEWSQVIGVVGDVRPGEALAGIDQQPGDQLYVPLAAGAVGRMPALVLKTSTPLANLSSRLRQELAAIDPTVAVVDLEPMATTLHKFYFAQHIWSRMFGLVAVAALLIAAVGAYGVSAYSVSRQRREMGVRLALGAAPQTLRAQVVRQGMKLAFLGLGLGLAGAFPMSSAMARLLHGTHPHDPLVIGGVVALLLVVGVLANALPARRAAKVDPVVALRLDG